MNGKAWIQLRDKDFSNIKHTLMNVFSRQEVEKLLKHLEIFKQAQWVYISKSKLYMFLSEQKQKEVVLAWMKKNLRENLKK